jgi:hypothetical protein
MTRYTLKQFTQRHFQKDQYQGIDLYYILTVYKVYGVYVLAMNCLC